MNRREFLVTLGGSSLVLLLPSLSSCGSSSTSGDLTVTSDADSTGHSHTFTIPGAKLATPGTGYSGSTSANGHFHTVSLSNGELTNIAGGSSVTKTSSTDSGHSHTFTFSKT